MPSLTKKQRKAKLAAKRRCRVVRDKKTRRRKKVCTPRKPAAKKVAPAKPAPVPQPLPGLPVPSAAAPPVKAPAPAPKAAPKPPAPKPAPVTAPPAPPVVWPTQTMPPELPLPVQETFGRREAERLLWRAGFGPRPGDVDRVAALGLQAAVESFTRVSGDAPLTGAEPRDGANPIDAENVWGHDHAWWFDRMVRSEHQLVERMTLIWHDWFATTNADVGNNRLMLAQNAMFRRHALGSFRALTTDVTRDPAMLIFLNGTENRRGRPNENYGRELMELFTLGADRGAYTETDVRELARALTGWRADWVDPTGWANFRFDPARWDTQAKTLWDGTPHRISGGMDWQDAVRACLEHPLHRSFFVRKLWSAFIPTEPSPATQAALESLYVRSDLEIRPVVEAILAHPDLYATPLVKPPVVFTAGLLRARSKTVTTSWAWRSAQAGQHLFLPPNVSGWNDQAWLDTATLRGRWDIVYDVINQELVDPGKPYDAAETVAQALAKALDFWGNPTITPETRAELERFAAAAIPAQTATWDQARLRAMRQNALRHLIAASPDLQTC